MEVDNTHHNEYEQYPLKIELTLAQDKFRLCGA